MWSIDDGPTSSQRHVNAIMNAISHVCLVGGLASLQAFVIELIIDT